MSEIGKEGQAEEISVSANKRYTREVLIFAVVWPLLYNAYFSSHSLGKHTSASMRLLPLLSSSATLVVMLRAYFLASQAESN